MEPHGKATRVRHIVLGLTVAAYMITYMDRVVISTAVPVIQKEFGFSLITMSYIIASFRWGYALFQIPGGWLGDRIGPRRALALIVTWWSLFTSATALAWNAVSMTVIRFMFGIGEAGAFPIATRSLSRWMLPAERGFAQGITHAGSRLGAAMTPSLVALVIAKYGWRSAFVMFGTLGVIWSAVWYWYYRDTPAEHASVNAAELELLASALGGLKSSRAQSVPWRKILSSPTLWTLSLLLFLLPRCLSGLVSHVPQESSRVQPVANGFLRHSPVTRGHRRRPAGRLDFRSLGQAHGQSEDGSPRCGSVRIPARRRIHSAGDPHHQPRSLRLVYLRRSLRAGVDRGGFVGGHTRYRRRLRRVGFRGHELLR